MPFLFLFLLWPLLEIFAFVAVMDEIGFFAAFFLGAGLMVAGGIMIQFQGLKTLDTIQSALRRGQLPVPELFDQACLFIAGVLFLVPGFLSDFLAVFLFFPPLRHRLRGVTARFFTGEAVHFRGFRREARQEDVIDAEFVIVDEDSRADRDRDRPLLP